MSDKARAAFLRAHRDPSSLPTGRFEWAGDRSAKVRCVECHRDGYGTTADPRPTVTFDGRLMPWPQHYSPWQIDCLGDHTWPCSCGLAFRRFVDLWRHIGADRPAGWGRPEVHTYNLKCEVAA